MNQIYVVGFGPGEMKYMTKQALDVIEASDVVIGYNVYVEIVKEMFPQKEYFSTPMTKERERCTMAFELASDGKIVAMVCSGDAGIYGMAGLMYEISDKYSDIEIVIVPGLSACISGASVLGAPLTHDFAVISLSDRLTEWSLIEKRLEFSSMADFSIVLYNPSSKGRPEHLKKACEIILQSKSEDTVCGIVRNIGREGQCEKVMTLKELKDTSVDMFTTVFIGNSQTKLIGNKMVTPRGYRE